jgi:hypothetical protein
VLSWSAFFIFNLGNNMSTINLQPDFLNSFSLPDQLLLHCRCFLGFLSTRNSRSYNGGITTTKLFNVAEAVGAIVGAITVLSIF